MYLFWYSVHSIVSAETTNELNSGIICAILAHAQNVVFQCDGMGGTEIDFLREKRYHDTCYMNSLSELHIKIRICIEYVEL